MSTDMQRLVVALEAKIDKFDKALARANGTANKRAKAIESRFVRMNKLASTSFAALGTKIAGAFAVAGGIRGAQQLLDTSTRILNALRVTGLEGVELKKVYDRLFDSAQKNAVPLEDMVTLYSRASMAAENLGASQADLEKFTNNVGVALRVSGKSATEASGALLQLSQLLGGNVVQAQEYNSLIDGAYPLLQAVAAGLEEAGGDVGKLTQLVKAGKVPTKAFFDAFQAGSVVLEEKVASSTLTVSAGFTKIYNSLVDAVGKIDEGTDSSKKLANALDQIAKAINSIDLGFVEDELAGIASKINKTIEDWNRWVKAYLAVKEALANGDLVGAADAAGDFFLDTTTAEQKVDVLQREVELLQAAIERNVELSADNTEALARLAEVQAAINAINASAGSGNDADVRNAINGMVPFNPLSPVSTPAKPVSLKNYKLDGDDKDKKSRRNEWERETAQIKERTAAIQAETAAMAGLNPLINDYGFALEKARAVAELENAALAAKVELTPQVRASIDSLATSYAQATVDAERLAESQDLIRERAQDMADLGKDVFGGFISDLRNGTSAAEALNNALGRIADTLINNVLDALFQINGAGGSGIFGALISGAFGAGAFPAAPGGGLYDSGGYTGPGPRKKAAGIVHKGEVVFSQDDVRRHGGVGAVEAMRLRGYSAGGPVGMPSVPSPGRRAANDNNAGIADIRVWVDQDGNWQAAVDRRARAQAQQVTANGLKAYDKGKQRQQMTSG
ncbi:tape measure protein [Mesorhizobium sp. YM1C-6-2]|uniref:tape measure protein n=1 Tax=Mesorhizobium sp. YM1C-6-2 TaxID=1827501 RepID=UPI001600C671|nr:tape measure protein [Mesorhizobium sp. YM1C-6-2]